MISHQLKQSARRWWRRRPRILAVFSFRHDHALVPDLIANVEPLVDGWVSFDDRASEAAYSDERMRRGALIDAARDLGARWILAVDPDERLEAATAEAIPRLTAPWRPTAWAFNLREMYSPDEYRVDGLWGEKRRARLFSMFPPQDLGGSELHGQWFPEGAGHAIRNVDLNIYHLRMISPQRRRVRRDLYNALDPERRFQEVGYDYLADESGLRLERVPAQRRYLPPHRDDGGLWSARPEEILARRPVESGAQGIVDPHKTVSWPN
ncbi:MAG: hypothetical protein U1E56_14360 [Bauldia sp.]